MLPRRRVPSRHTERRRAVCLAPSNRASHILDEKTKRIKMAYNENKNEKRKQIQLNRNISKMIYVSS